MKRADIPHLSVANTAVHKHGCHPPFKSLNAFTYVLDYTKKNSFFQDFSENNICSGKDNIKCERKRKPPDALFFYLKKHRKRGENVRNYRYLTFGDREKIETEYAAGGRPADIAIDLGVHVATIYKELKRGDTGQLDKNMRREYSAELAQRRLIESFKCRGRKSPTI